MLWFYHPRPFNRKEVAVQMAARKEDQAARTEFITIDHTPQGTPGLRQGNGPEAASPTPIRFDVSYSLGEYLGILGEHLGYLDKKSRRTTRFAPGLLPALGCAVVAAAAQLTGVGWLAGAAIAGVLLVAALCLPFMARPWVTLIATPIFLLKRWRMGTCNFTIDHERIEGVSTLGRLSRTWRDVLFVHRYSQGYLVVFTKGAIPIPYRCLDTSQLQRLRALVASRPR